MLIRPPYGDHAACPVSSYSTTSTFGAPSGARSARNAGQSAVESRTSSSIFPWNGRGIGDLLTAGGRASAQPYVAARGPASREVPASTSPDVRRDGWVGSPASSTARANTSSSMSGVRRPVKVFCWLGWNEHTSTGPPATATSTPWPKRGRGRTP